MATLKINRVGTYRAEVELTIEGGGRPLVGHVADTHMYQNDPLIVTIPGKACFALRGIPSDWKKRTGQELPCTVAH